MRCLTRRSDKRHDISFGYIHVGRNFVVFETLNTLLGMFIPNTPPSPSIFVNRYLRLRATYCMDLAHSTSVEFLFNKTRLDKPNCPIKRSNSFMKPTQQHAIKWQAERNCHPK